MDDDDESGLLEVFGDAQTLNYFLHGTSGKLGEHELTNSDFSTSNSNSIFANANVSDPKISIKSGHSQSEKEPSDGLHMQSGIPLFEHDLESSPMADLSEDILQKSLQEANITEQILAEEAYLDASIGSSQQMANAALHSHSSASFTSSTNASTFSGHSMGVSHVPVVPQQVGGAGGMQHAVMQHVGIIPNQHMACGNHYSSGQIHFIGSISNQSPMMTINNMDGSHVMLKKGQQAPSNASGGLLIQKQQAQNGSAMYGNSSPASQPVAVPFSSSSFHTSLPLQNIIIHRGPVPIANKTPINIQPKPVQVGQQMSYNVSNVGIHHHGYQAVPFVSSNSAQISPVGQQIHVNQQAQCKSTNQQSAGSIVIHSSQGQHQGHHNQILIPTSLSVNNCSVQHNQTGHTQFVPTQASHLGPHQVSTEHLMQNRHPTGMVRSSQHYPGQILHNPDTSLQLVSGQTFTGPGGQVILYPGPSQIVGGQMAQISPTLVHLSPCQGNSSQGRSSGTSTPTGCSTTNRLTVVTSGTVLQNVAPSFQSPGGGKPFIAEQSQKSPCSAINETYVPGSTPQSTNMFGPSSVSQQTFSCNQPQQKMMDHLSPSSLLKNQERQSHVPGSLPDHSSGGKNLQQLLSFAEQQKVKVEAHPRGQKRRETKQLTKETLIVQQLQKDQKAALMPFKTPFTSIYNAAQCLLPYHLFQGTLPTEEDLQGVDDEFEVASTYLLQKTQSMLNKYRSLLLEDAMRIDPSAEMVMLGRMFNEEERGELTHGKRSALVDPDAYLAEFCCAKKFLRDSSEGKPLGNSCAVTNADSLAASSSNANISEDQTDLGKTSNQNPQCLVPVNNLSSEKYTFSEKLDSLTKDGKLKNPSLSPRVKLLNICKKAKYNECPSNPDMSGKASKELDCVAKVPMSIPDPRSKVTAGHAELHQGKTLQPAVETMAGKLRDIPASPGKHCKGLKNSEAVKATVRNVLELKLSAKHLQSEVRSSSSAEVELVKCSPAASEDNCADKPISDTRERAAETDSVLEAAVNSILEC